MPSTGTSYDSSDASFDQHDIGRLMGHYPVDIPENPLQDFIDIQGTIKGRCGIPQGFRLLPALRFGLKQPGLLDSNGQLVGHLGTDELAALDPQGATTTAAAAAGRRTAARIST